MNSNCYKVIFSKRLGALVAVGEHATSSGKAASGQASRGVASPSSCATIAWGGFVGALRFSFASVALACLSLGSTQAQSIRPPLASNALPTGALINAGSASISTSGAQMAITQSTDKTSINWNSFNIGSGASVNIAQPSSSSVLLNRVVGQDPSQIFGKLSANGQVILLNPNGIAFGRDGSVTATSFTASTFNLTDADFMSGFYKYNRNGSTASIVNEGTIETSAGGFVALIGASVTNDGKIIAPQGNVVLAAAESVTLQDAVTATQSPPASTVSVPLSKKVRLELLPATINTAITNTPSGVIVTDGGQVLLQAAAISTAVASITHSGSIDTSGNQGGAVQVLAENGNIKVNGSITANSTGTDNNNQPLKGGDIIIGRDEQTGALAKATDVSGARLESNKGFVETSGQHLDSLGVNVKAAEWLLDPTDITIVSADTATANTPKTNASGTDTYQQTIGAFNTSEILNTDISTALSNGTNVLIKTTNGSATGSGDITVSANINATSATAQDATLTLQAERDIVVNNTISRTGSNKLNVILNSDLDGNGTGIIRLNSGATISSNGGDITLGGGTAGDGTGYARGYAASSRAEGIVLFGATLAAAGGNIAIKGQGSGSTLGGTFQAMGVNVTGTSSVSTTGAGNINITGQGGNGSDTNAGVGIHASSTVTGSATGTVTLTGTGGNGGNYDFGVWISDNSNTKVTTTGGSVIVNGTGGGSGGSGQHDGVVVQNYANLGATGTGTVTITGTAAGTGTGAGGGNSNGVELLTYGSITAGSGNINITGNANVAAALGNGVALNAGSSISNAANITIQGNSSTNGMGVNMAAGSSVTSSGANATISISSNNLMVHSGAITTTNSTGTGTNINLTAATGGITGGGTIGNSTNKNASVSMSTATTGSFSGGINALNFTKAGAGTLTLDSWAQATPVMTNVSNSYNINAGRLNLNTGSNYYTVRTSTININNATTFGVTGGNGTWDGNTFVFDSGGGGTIVWTNNPIMNVGTAPLTFRTNGGNTNTISGYFNMNAGTGITFDVMAASTASNPGLLLSGTGNGFANSWSAVITKTGTGLLRAMNNLQTPTLNVNAGTWEFGDGSTGAGSYSVTTGNIANYNIASGAFLSFNTPSAVTMNNPSTTFAGAGTIVKKGAGSIQWGAGAATFNLSTGSLIDVQGGTFVGSSSANEVWSSNNSSLNIASGATFQTVEGQIQVDALNGAGSLVLGTTSSAYTSRMTVGVQGSSGSYSGAISNIASFNNGTFNKVGTGTQSLTGTNTYTGATTISGGTLQVTNIGSFYSNAIAIGSGAVFEANVATNTNYSANTAVSGAGTFRKTGVAGLSITTGGNHLTFGNNAGGLIDIQAGLIQNNNIQANLANNLASINIASGAVLDIRGESVQMNGLTGGGTVFNSWAAAVGTLPNTITIGVGASSADTNTFSGIIGSTVVDATMFPNTATNYSGSAALANGRSSAGINVVKTNTASTQIFTGANTYSGTTTIKGGTLVIGDSTSGAIGSGNITIDGANTVLSFKNAGSTQTSLAQTVTGNGTIQADKAIAFSGTITINKSAADGNNNLTIKTTGADNTNIGAGRSINLNSNIVQAGADDVKLTVDSYSSLYANATGAIGSSAAGLGKLDVDMTSRGLNQTGQASSVYSLGMSLSKAINANGGTVALNAYESNTNAASGGAGGALIFNTGSGITAGNFTAAGTYAGGNIGSNRAGITTAGTTNFTITGSGTGTLVGTSNSNDTPWSVGLYTAGTINLNSGSGQINLQAPSTRYEANLNTNSSGGGAVTLGVATGSLFQRSGTITAQTGTLNIVGNSISTYNASAAIKGNNSTTINLSAPTIRVGNGPLASEGGPTIGLATGATGFSLNINADNLDINTGDTPPVGNNSGAGTTTIQNFTAGTKINIGGSDVAAAGATPATLGLTNAELNTFSASKLVIGSITAGDVTVSNATTTNAATGNIALVSGANIAVNAALTIGGTKNLTLDGEGATSAITQSAAITATGLELLGANAAYTLTNNSNSVGTIAGTAKSINLKDNTALTVNIVNASNGLTTSGDITLDATTATLDSSGIWVMGTNVKTTAGGNINLTGTNTANTGTSAASFGVRIGGGTIGDANTGTVTVTGSSTLDTGVMLGATGAIQSKNLISISGTGVGGSNIAGTVSSLAGGGNFNNGNAISITGVSSNNTTGLALSGSVLNNSTSGKTYIKSTQGQLYLSSTTQVTNESSAGAVELAAGNNSSTSSASIGSAAGATITQNSAAAVTVTTDGQGNLLVPKIVKGSGAGDVTVGAGVLVAAGATGGNILTVSGNTITNSGSGKTLIYTGSAANTGALSYIDTTLSNLYLTSGAGGTQNAVDLTAYGSGGGFSGGPSTEVLFRETVDLTSTLSSAAIINKNYGDAVPSVSDFSNAVVAANGSTLSKVFSAATFNASTSSVATEIASHTTLNASNNSFGRLNTNTLATGYTYTNTGGHYATSGTSPNVTLVVNKINATVTGNSDTTKTYNGLSQSVTGFSASGLLSGETISNLTGVSATGASGINAGTYTNIVSGAYSNYNTTLVNGSLVIGKTNATVTANSDSTKIYNGQAQSVTGFTATGLVNGETTSVLTGVTASGTGTNAGTYTSVASGTDSNYNLSFVNGSLVINKASLSASLQGTVSKDYDNTTAATLTGSNFSLTGWISGEGATVTQTLGAYASPNVSANNGSGLVSTVLSSNQFVASGITNLDNYVLPSTASGNIGRITPAALTIKVNNSAAFVTQDASQSPDMGFSFTGLKGGDSASTVLTGGALTSANRSYTDPTGTVVANHPTAGSYTGIFGLTTTPSAANGNYTITVQKGDLLVAPADKLLITVSSASDTYGNRTAADAGQANTVSAHYCLDANVACTGANYAALTLTQQTGNQWKASDSTGSFVVFDTVLTSAAYSQSGFLKAGNYNYDTTQINPLSLPNGNFNGRVTNGGVLTINRLSLNPTGSSTSKAYDGSTGVSGVTLTPAGAMSGDDVGVSASVGAFATKDVGNNIAVTMSGLSLTGTDASNYALASNALSTTGSITAKVLSLTGAVVASKTYDGITSATLSSNGSLTGLVGNETLTLSGLTASYANANVGLGKTVGLSATLANGSNGGLATNYSLLNASTTGDITPKLLTLSGTTVGNKIYDGSTKATITALGSLSGFVGSETVLLSGVSGTFATASAGSNVAVTLQANLQDGTNGGLASNYSVGTSTAYANITPVNNAIIRPPVVPTSSSSSSGNGSGGKSGSSPNPYLALPMEPASAERCTPNNLESCQCDTQGGDGEVAICYEPQKTAEIRPKTKSRRS